MTAPQIAHAEPARAGFFMPRRLTDAAWLNELANHPSIHRWVCGPHKGALDLTDIVADPANICLGGEHAAEVFIAQGPGVYEVHSLCLPEGRGAWMLDFMHRCVNWIFTRTDCIELVGRCPHGNRPVKTLARSINATLEFTNPTGWIIDGRQVPADIYALRIQDWMRTAPGLDERGQWFHARLDEEFARLGRSEPQHDDDPVHDRYVGAAVEMFMGGQPYKAAILYNRWARLADYAPIGVMRETPLVIDIGNAILVIRDGDFYVATLKPEH